MTELKTQTTLDLREIPPRDRHPLIFSTLRQLEAGEALELVNDHDPVPLHHHLQAEFPGRFSWQYLQSGPHAWHVQIGKLAPAAHEHRCCGSCGGA
jgi:uncharacterized protein (DUF2249 family)